MKNITDIWFKTNLKLNAIADFLNKGENLLDSENYWEWVEFPFNGYDLNITRTHQKRRNETDTRVFLLSDNKNFTNELMNEICLKLVELEIRDIQLGHWIYISGNTYDKVVLDKWK